MKKLIAEIIVVTLIAVLFCNSSCNKTGKKEPGKITVNIELTGTPGGQVWFEELKVYEITKIDSFVPEEGETKTIKISTDKAGLYLLRNTKGQVLTLQLEPGENVTLNADAGDLEKEYCVTGSPGSEILKSYADVLRLTAAKYDSLKEIFEEANKIGEFGNIREHLDSAYYNLVAEHKSITEGIIRKNPSLLSSVYLLNQKLGPQLLFGEKNDLALFEMVDSGVLKKYPANEHALDHHKRVLVYKEELKRNELAEENLVKGKKAGDFALTALDGKRVSLSSFSGKPILVYFWQSTDALCRKENIELMRFYTEGKGKKPRLLCVSFDTDPEMTKAAVKIDGLPGVHLNDPSGIKSSIVSLYNLKGKLPRYFLIDGNGNISAGANSVKDMVKELAVN